MIRIILDACVLGDFFSQYFDASRASRGQARFTTDTFLSTQAANEINKIIESHRSDRDRAILGKVVIPPLALIELVRKWDEMVKERFSPQVLKAAIQQQPDWLNIASWDSDLLPYFLQVPNSVFIDGVCKSIEWTDAVYPATALSYGEGNVVATSDKRLIALGQAYTKVKFY
ncbi:MAG: hypothetical protein IPK22_19270 [Verrucomicrobiaceae bacterium]|nr:hypothetical protein [Verrucomicrobiaceae bacterium]